MDIHCSHCREPWDVYHLRHDMPYDVADEKEIKATWYGDGPGHCNAGSKLDKYWRNLLESDGWVFGQNVFVIKHCPCCPDSISKYKEKESIGQSTMAEALGDDMDALASELEDHGL